MSVSLMNNTGIKESLNNYSFNDIEEKNSENKSSKSKEKEKCKCRFNLRGFE